MLQRDYWQCPFCEKGMIEILLRPATFSFKKVKSGKGKATISRKIKEEIMILTAQCSVCGKTADEIRRKWKEQGVI